MIEKSTSYEFTVGLFGIGLDTYWPQFEGLRQRLTGYTQQIAQRLEKPGVRVVNLGLVDSPEKAEAAGHSLDRKSTRLNSSHGYISYAVFCLKQKHPHSSVHFPT